MFEIGSQHGYLKIIDRKSIGKYRKSYVVECVCGKKYVLGHSRLTENKNRKPDKSCGCKQKAQNGSTMTDFKLYHVWKNMHKRANGAFEHNRESYKNVTVCEEWLSSFESFMKWSKDNGYKEGLTLDRIDNAEGYTPKNCRWTTYAKQQQNKGAHKNNKLGIKGICSHGDAYRAHISRDGIRKHLGRFKTIEQATEARRKAEKFYEEHGHLNF